MTTTTKTIKKDQQKQEDYLITKMEREQWLRAHQKHTKLIDDVVSNYLEKREQQQKNPILDFLFEYYHFPPSKLKQWSPGFGTLLCGYERNMLEINELTTQRGYAWLDPNKFKSDKLNSLIWIKELLESTASNRPFNGCFGMHEWAMVYQTNSIRHSYLPLRFSKQKIDAIVDENPLLCTHYDAYRFFTKPAKPKNAHQLNRERFDRTEQPGCIHTNMDLYKWAFKYYPWISSDTIKDAFMLALEARTIDMQASPYDLSDFGLLPIKVETAAGKKKYADHQMRMYKKSQPIRKKLIEEYTYLITCLQ